MQWNDLDAAQSSTGSKACTWRGRSSTRTAFVACELFLVRLKLAQGDTAGAAALLAAAEQAARQQSFVRQLPEIAALHVLVSLRQRDLAAAAQAAQAHDLPLSQARVDLAQGDTAAALAALAAYRQQAEVKGWADERLKAMILQALAHQAHGERGQGRGPVG